MSEESISKNTVITETTECCVKNCIFCNVIAINDPNTILEPRSDKFVVIKDIRPVAMHHFLVLSHKHIQNAKSLQSNDEDRNLLESMITGAKQVLSNNGCDMNDIRIGFHWPPFYSVKHLHLHAISPVSSMSFINRFIAFNPNFSYVFVDVDYVRKRIGYEVKKEKEDQDTVKQCNL